MAHPQGAVIAGRSGQRRYGQASFRRPRFPDDNKPAAEVSPDFLQRVYFFIVIYPFSFVFNCRAWSPPRRGASILYEAVRPNGCDGISQLDASLVIVQNPGLGRYRGSDWGLRNLLNDSRVRIDKVKVATVFSTPFPTLCLFRKASGSAGILPICQPLAAGSVCKLCTC